MNILTLFRYGMSATGVGDEGGFAPDIQENKAGLELITKAIEAAGYTGKIEIGMDIAASEFHKNGKYDLDFKNKDSDPSKYLTPDELGKLYQDWISQYPIVSIEDPFDQDDWDAWTKYCSQVKNQVVG